MLHSTQIYRLGCRFLIAEQISKGVLSYSRFQKYDRPDLESGPEITKSENSSDFESGRRPTSKSVEFSVVRKAVQKLQRCESENSDLAMKWCS